MPKKESEYEAFVPPQPVQAPPVTKRPERYGGSNVPRVRRYPEIRAGVCEYHGTVNPYAPGEEQYLYCPNDGKHPKYSDLQCSYCEDYKDPKDVIKKATLNIYDHPTDPSQLVIVCDNFNCTKAHQERFKISN